MRPRKRIAIFCVDSLRASELCFLLGTRCRWVNPYVVGYYSQLLEDPAAAFVLIDAPDEARELMFRVKPVVQVCTSEPLSEHATWVKAGDIEGLIDRLAVATKGKRGPKKEVA